MPQPGTCWAANSWGNTWAANTWADTNVVANFIGSPTNGFTPLSVAFTDLSTGAPDTWHWEKSSDGGSTWADFAGTPTAQNPIESLTNDTWSIRLTASKGADSNTKTVLNYVSVVTAGTGGGGGMTLLGAGRA